MERGLLSLFSDTQVKDERFVLDISSILNTGEVPNIFLVDEKMEIVDRMRVHAKELKDGKNMTTNELFEFSRRLKDNLHIVLAFSPIGEAFRSRLRKFHQLLIVLLLIGSLHGPQMHWKLWQRNFWLLLKSMNK